MVRLIADGRSELSDGLEELGWVMLPSVCNFVLGRVGPGAAALADTLMWEQGLVVRSFRPGSRLEDHLRVTVRTPGDHERLLSALEEDWMMSRSAERSRETRETKVRVALDLDGSGRSSVSTGVGFLDHLLGSLAHHALFDLEIEATGDLEVDDHHIVEDVALVLGEAIALALGDRSGITRFGDAVVPMDEAIARASVDAGGRPFTVIELEMRNERIGNLTTQNLPHALESLCRTLRDHAPSRGEGRERPSRRRGRLQGAGPVAARRRRDRPEASGNPIDQRRAMTAPLVAVVDHGAGNLVSIAQGLERAGATVRVAAGPAGLTGCDGVVLPGVGATAAAMERLRSARMVERPQGMGRVPCSGSASVSSFCSKGARRTVPTA